MEGFYNADWTVGCPRDEEEENVANKFMMKNKDEMAATNYG